MSVPEIVQMDNATWAKCCDCLEETIREETDHGTQDECPGCGAVWINGEFGYFNA